MTTDELAWRRLERLISSLADRLAPERGERAVGVTSRTSAVWSAPLSGLAAAGDPTGTIVALTGRRVANLLASDAAARVEVAFGSPSSASSATATGAQTVATSWIPLVPGSSIPAPGGGTFSELRVRAAQGTPADATRRVLLAADVEPGQSVEEVGRFANVSPGGAYEALLKVLSVAGAELSLEGAVGSGALRGALATALLNPGGTDYVRALGTTLGRAQVAPIAGQEGVAAGAGAVGATVQRVTLASDDPAVVDLAAIEALLVLIDADTSAINALLAARSVNVGAPDANTPRVVEATPATTTIIRATATTTVAVVASSGPGRSVLYLKNLHATETIYLGTGGALTTANGWPLDPGEIMPWGGGGAVYALVAAGTAELALWQES